MKKILEICWNVTLSLVESFKQFSCCVLSKVHDGIKTIGPITTIKLTVQNLPKKPTTIKYISNVVIIQECYARWQPFL
jgi:hypothetical protein